MLVESVSPAADQPESQACRPTPCNMHCCRTQVALLSALQALADIRRWITDIGSKAFAENKKH
eukprot:1156241-Pelagomonas_calceolata.AAC.2